MSQCVLNGGNVTLLTAVRVLLTPANAELSLKLQPFHSTMPTLTIKF